MIDNSNIISNQYKFATLKNIKIRIGLKKFFLFLIFKDLVSYSNSKIRIRNFVMI